MSKNIILLSDGTGNSASNLFKSNVWRLYQALDLRERDPTDPRQPKQIAYHDDGVGTASLKPLALIGGAFGWGLRRNVLDLYCFLCRHYDADEKKDGIYAFGFSRGAFTIRVLTGLILSQGLIQTVPDKNGQPQPVSESERRRLAKDAYRRFRDDVEYKGLLSFMRPALEWLYWVKDWVLDRRLYHRDHNTQVEEIKFLGVWDTVAAYGLPFDELTRAWDFIFPLAFPERGLDKRVKRACHALALDDERLSFHPELWNEEKEDEQEVCKLKDEQPTVSNIKDERIDEQPKISNIKDERISQVWFAGMHSNVGGSYPDDGMSFVPFNWIIEQASAKGLVFDESERKKIEAAANPYGKMYDSRRGFGGFYRYKPRKLAELANDDRGGEDHVKVALPKIHQSVFHRIHHNVDGYAPIGLPEKYAVVTAKGEIVQLAQAAGAANPHHIEGVQQADGRRKRQEKLWNLVWVKRQVYLLTVAMALLLVLMPYYRLPLNWEWARSFIEPLIAFVVPPLLYVVSKFTPSMFSSWIEAFQAHPNYFSFFTALFLLTMAWGDQLQRRIFDGMRSLWQAVFAQPGAVVSVTPEPKDWLYRYRSNTFIQGWIRWVKEKLIPALLLPLLLWLGYGLCHRVAYLFENSVGYVCRPSEGVLKESLAGVEFKNDNLCWASGVGIKKGLRYRITMELKEDPAWMDSTIPTGIHGFKLKGNDEVKLKPWHTKLFMYATQPLRRLPDEDWFKPIARIGSARGDEFPLNPEKGLATVPSDRSLTSEFTASKDGELFLFVNDFVTPVPKWQPTYANNHGVATVTIKQVEPPPSK